MIRLTRLSCLVVALALCAPCVAAQGRHVFVLSSGSVFTFSGQVTLPPLPASPIVGQPSNQFSVQGAADVDLTLSAGVATNGQLVTGGVVSPTSPLMANVPNPIPFLPPLATMSVTGLSLEITSPPFAITQGNFSTMVTTNILAGTANVTTLGSTSTIPLGGAAPPQAVSGTLVSTPTGFAVTVPLNVTFTFMDPGTGAVGTLTMTGNLVADHQPPNAGTQGISASAGGVQTLVLSTGGPFGGDPFWVLASGSGTSPGTPIGGGFVLPLNADAWFLQSIQAPNQPPFGNNMGTLDAVGKAVATITVPPGLPPSVVGLSFDFAYATASTSGVIGLVSNPFPLVLLP